MQLKFLVQNLIFFYRGGDRRVGRNVSLSKFDIARKQTGRDFDVLNPGRRKLGINNYDKPSFSPDRDPSAPRSPIFQGKMKQPQERGGRWRRMVLPPKLCIVCDKYG
ncbi:MAG TPA: hypothetical protein DEG17_15185 [Cyanobacteria bacterium UBA11149]|nr:hypothetical protein [Cyanobacteria bacterium UBA11367]HBE56315.1 hypothetical protein [Cyanobacteria bacterium UBA11366]HBK64048.1 hypothetical protein [Cyanobacteria bacterium UBA11166]HBR72566.1 hypothetical protein [Cyanobacteria bacterium UBA11159]HBS71663.1 hypothetical protein [Cyanobacteria bacterium UBA11153]HBW90177.1 hypothetical protein [Cyanobacteria bacterium UBA11149]HCA97747.1 hypothetical protein [Cyanobacteria bacterium UBA9226]